MHHRAVEHRVGDLVLLSSKNLSFKNIPTKLQKKFLGPFEVVEKIGSQAYRLKLPESWKIVACPFGYGTTRVPVGTVRSLGGLMVQSRVRQRSA